MPRRSRLITENQPHHIVQRGGNKQNIFTAYAAGEFKRYNATTAHRKMLVLAALCAIAIWTK